MAYLRHADRSGELTALEYQFHGLSASWGPSGPHAVGRIFLVPKEVLSLISALF